MKRLLSSAGWLLAVLVFVLSIGVAAAQDRPISLMPGTDLPGFDYSTIKNTTLDACSAACSDDKLFRAFTFNEKADRELPWTPSVGNRGRVSAQREPGIPDWCPLPNDAGKEPT